MASSDKIDFATLMEPQRLSEFDFRELSIPVGWGSVNARLADFDGDGTFGSSGDRWMTNPWGNARMERDDWLPLDTSIVTAARLALRPILNPDGSLAAPYRFRSSVPEMSSSDFVKADYTRRSQGHPPIGDWSWWPSSGPSSLERRPTLFAWTPPGHPESWRWDAELFADQAVQAHLSEAYVMRRFHAGRTLVPFGLATSEHFKNGREHPILFVEAVDGTVISTNNDVATPEALLRWLEGTQAEARKHASPSPTRRTDPRWWQRR